MHRDAKDIGELQDCMMQLETEVSQLAHRSYRTKEPEIETLMAFCVRLRSFSVRLFDLQTRLMRPEPLCACEEKTDDSEPECQP